MKILYSSEGLEELEQILEWNSRRYSVDHAKSYIDWLKQQIELVELDLDITLPVPERENYRMLLMRRPSATDGHIAILEFRDQRIIVLHIFHTKQDWQNSIKS